MKLDEYLSCSITYRGHEVKYPVGVPTDALIKMLRDLDSLIDTYNEASEYRRKRAEVVVQVPEYIKNQVWALDRSSEA